MNGEQEYEVQYDPWNGDYILVCLKEQEGRQDAIRIERWQVALVMAQLREGNIKIFGVPPPAMEPPSSK